MGCPVGIGPEIILSYFKTFDNTLPFSPVVIGDIEILSSTARKLKIDMECVSWQPNTPLISGTIPVHPVSKLDPAMMQWGKPNQETGLAMAHYIESGVELVLNGILDGITTCPIAKISLQQAGYNYPGHTEMLAQLSNSKHFAMMLAGDKLRVTLATIHCPFAEIHHLLNENLILELIRITHRSLKTDFGISRPRLGIAGLNPHAGENGIFGREEIDIIKPAVTAAQQEGIDAQGPFPPDTVFFKAANGQFDCVVCMYHDQGLIPFKLLHFSDGVNVTLGLPIVRTSVDHGTAYDIAGQGIADHQSLAAAVNLAYIISSNRKKNR